MSIEPTGLPPRGARKKQTSSPVSLKKLLQSGLVLFGALFFGLIGVELYQAKMNHPTTAEGSPVVTAENPTDVQSAPAVDQTSSAPAADVEPSAQAAPSTTEPIASPSSVQTAPAKTEQPAPPPSSPAAPSAEQKSSSSVTTQTGTKEATGKAATASKPVTDASKTVTAKAQTAEKPKAVKHVVKKGETLYMLSRKYYGNNSNVARIANYNGISLEAQLTEGKIVMVPISQ